MDGNGRWAATRALPVAEGHREGARALRRTVEAAIELGVESLAVYAFSTENWARPADEVESIMELMDETIDRELPDLAEQGVRTRFFGRRDRVPGQLDFRVIVAFRTNNANQLRGRRKEFLRSHQLRNGWLHLLRPDPGFLQD